MDHGTGSFSMHKYSGVILDYYDDKGATLKAKFPTVDELPDTIKTASVQPREALPLEAFALVAVDGTDVLRKYACHDAGTTAMSVIYFMEHGDKLPEDAQKTAAANLVDACVDHGMLPPAALTKTAGSGEWVSKNLPTLTAGGKWLGQAAGALPRAIGRNLARGAKEEVAKDKGKILKAVEEAGEKATTGATRAAKTELTSKGGKKGLEEASETVGKGVQKGISEASPSGHTLRNVAILGTVGGTGLAAGTAAGRAIGKKSVEEGERLKDKLMGTEKSASVIDITGKSPMTKVKRASVHTMYDGKFPIDSWDQIKKAEAYLMENDCRLAPDVRRECAVKLASRAVDVGYPVDDSILENGAYGFAPIGELVVAVEMRKVAGADVGILHDLMEKRAHMGPDTYAECLRRFDIENGLDSSWDNRVPDPYRSTFGLAKTAAVVWEDGADRVDEGQLENLATNHKDWLKSIFTDSMITGFCSDPVDIFKSLPLGEKRTIARLAADLSSDGSSEGMPKEAKLRVSDIEDELGIYLPDKQEAKARKMIEYKKQRSFAMRHPWLTGIPTLGIAPTIAKGRARRSIANRMAREDPQVRAATNKSRAEKRQQALEDFQLNTERAKAEQAERVAGALGSALVGAMSARNRDRQREREHRSRQQHLQRMSMFR
jgi:hypothetical protein